MVSTTRTVAEVAAASAAESKTGNVGTAFRGGKAQQADSSDAVPEYKMQIVWQNVAKFVWIHLLAVNGIYCMFATASWQTLAFSVVCYVLAGLVSERECDCFL